jgi:hypothetical protein
MKTKIDDGKLVETVIKRPWKEIIPYWMGRLCMRLEPVYGKLNKLKWLIPEIFILSFSRHDI